MAPYKQKVSHIQKRDALEIQNIYHLLWIYVEQNCAMEPHGVCFSMQSRDGAPFDTDDCTSAQNQDHGLKKICASSRDIVDRLTDTTHHQPSNKLWHACLCQRFKQKHLHQNLGNRILIFNQFMLLTPLCQLTPLPHPLCQSSQWGAIARQCLASDPGAT